MFCDNGNQSYSFTMGPADDKEVISEKISNLKPPEMIKNASDYDVYKREDYSDGLDLAALTLSPSLIL